ncbi:MAG TPA: hypothetical protein VEC19_11325 [Usitatibacter sp.]|nr:hypothetical protein [Usitatibacter sp.]
MKPPTWFEVEIPRNPDFKAVAECFFRDFCAVHAAAGIAVSHIHHEETLRGDRYFVPPEAARLYFLAESRSAVADWLLDIQLARPCAEPEVKALRPLPC